MQTAQGLVKTNGTSQTKKKGIKMLLLMSKPMQQNGFGYIKHSSLVQLQFQKILKNVVFTRKSPEPTFLTKVSCWNNINIQPIHDRNRTLVALALNPALNQYTTSTPTFFISSTSPLVPLPFPFGSAPQTPSIVLLDFRWAPSQTGPS